MLDIHIPNRLKWLLRRSRGILFRHAILSSQGRIECYWVL